MGVKFNPFTSKLDIVDSPSGEFSDIELALGTQSAPSLSFTGDPNTGIYSPSANQLAISTNGTGKVFIDSNGNVAIGGSTVQKSLTLNYLNASIGLSAASAGTYSSQGLFFYVDATAYSQIYNEGVGNLVFRNGSGLNERMRLDSSGRLGLGTSSPSVKLEVKSPGSATNVLQVTPTTGSGYFRVRETGGNDIDVRLADAAGTESVLINSDGATYFNGGNVGIGTQSPQTKLEVNNDSTTEIEVARFRSNGNTNNPMIRFVVDESQNVRRIDANGSVLGALAFNQGSNERMRIDSSGRLLVGTSSNRSIASVTSSLLQVETTTNFALSLAQNANTNGAAVLSFGKSRGTAAGGTTVVQSGDDLGSILFAGADGTDVQSRAASIVCSVDGTPDANDMPGRLVFSTTADGASSPTERMRITQEGNITIGSAGTAVDASSGTADGVTIYGASGVTISRNNANAISLRRRLGDGNIAAFYRDTTVVGTISVTTTATAYNTSSDYRLKENVVPLTGAADRLNQLQVHRFNFIADPDTTVDGFIAHEAQAVVPECVTGTKDEVDDEGNPVYQGIDQSKLVPLLTAALQEALAEIESLKARVTALEP